MGENKKAIEAWAKAVNLRQNDYLSDIYFYKAMSLKKLGKVAAADSLFIGLISLGKERIEREEVDFFAKFGERSTPDDRKADGHYLMGLGYLGKEMFEEAKQEFTRAVNLNMKHIWAAEYMVQTSRKHGL
jgi:tetratricopeptide (TPR) repeat protein